MKRPQYESQQDRENEAEAIRLTLAPYGVAATKLPKKYEVDYLLRRGEALYGWAEVKCRPNIESYPTVMISLRKVMSGQALARAAGGRFLLIVWGRKLRVQDIASVQPANVTFGGRADRGDPEDIELVAHYPLEAFHVIESAPAVSDL